MPRRPIPKCPNGCGPIYSTHRCTVSALATVQPSREITFGARPLRSVPTDLVPAPIDWRDRVDAELEGWQERAARPSLVSVDDLDWQ